VIVGLDEIASFVDALLANAAETDDAHVVIVDDADSVDDAGHLERLLVAGPPRVHVVASARADRLRAAYRHWTTEVRRSRIGVLLRPDDVDGELLGVRLPRGHALARVAGRGYLVTDQGVDIVQLAHHDEPDAGGQSP
jgi:S-DNA-T family DNA segregation ATPase FtsK/SpoIIIE